MAQPQTAPDRPETAAGGELRLPKPPGVIRQFWARHPRLTDGLIAGLYFVPTVLGTIVGAVVPEAQAIWLTIAQLGAVAAAAASLLLFRRSRPWLVLAVAWVACLFVAPYGAIDVLPTLLGLYALAVYGSTRAAWIGFGCSVAVGTASAYLSTWVRDAATVEPFGADASATAVQFAIMMLIATLIGVTVGNRRRYLDALIARALDLARERDQQSRLAAAAERARIAREMHDIVSHGLTVMITLAEGSAATIGREPARAVEAMRHVADTGRDALGEMRRMLGVLSDASGEDATRAPQPDVAAIPDLVEGFREAGLPVTLTTIGAPVDGPTLQLAVYRVVQEGLTNVLRHADGPLRVEVRIEHRGDAVDISVVDDAMKSAATMSGAGRGLDGLRERVALHRGTLEAGPLDGRGWRLHVLLMTDATELEEHE